MDFYGQFRALLDFEFRACVGDFLLGQPAGAAMGDEVERSVPDDDNDDKREQKADDDKKFGVRPPWRTGQRNDVDASVAAHTGNLRRCRE